MSLGSQFRAFQRKRSEFLQEIFGTNEDDKPVQIDYDRSRFTWTGYYTPIKDKWKTEEAGFIDDHDSIVRVRKEQTATSGPPELNKQVKIVEGEREINLVINEILGSHPASVEWMLGCDALN
jgi:hypothetical protein